MILIGLGASHQTASLELREHLSFNGMQLSAAYQQYAHLKTTQQTPITELVILTTCNRTELYACVSGNGIRHADPGLAAAPLIAFLAEQSGLTPARLRKMLTRTVGLETIRHLHRVAAGLESMVIGEPQILGQVSAAYQAAVEAQAIGPVLSAVFRSAVHAGKRVRGETAIGRNPATIGSVAVHLAEEALGSLRSRDVLVVGAGEMGSLATASLSARDPHQVTVISRSFKRAEDVAVHYCATAAPYEKLEQVLDRSDLAVVATASPAPIIGPDLIERVMSARQGRPVVLVDISMPRNIDPKVKAIDGVRLFDIDDLQHHLNGAIAGRIGEIPRAEAIIAAELKTVEGWLAEFEVFPAIAGLHQKAESIRQQELERALRRLPDLDEATREELRLFSLSLVKKLLHEPTRRLKAQATDGHALEYAEALAYLFGLPADSDLPQPDHHP